MQARPELSIGHLNRLVLLVALALAAYHNSFDGAFLFDDQSNILGSPDARVLWPKPLSPRIVWNFSLAVNFALAGEDPWGYHVFNLAVHIACGLTLYGIVRRTLRLPRFHERYCTSADWLALAVAAIWLVHPLGTQAVTYIVQRGEAMMTLAFLFCLYATLRGATADVGTRWYAVAVIGFWIGMGCKEPMAMAPLVVLLYDRTFLATSWSEVVRRRGWLYASFLPPLIWISWHVAAPLFHSQSASSAGFGYREVTPLEYLATQPQVVLHYLRLVFWPHPLVLDYGWPVETSLIMITITGSLVALIVVLAIVGLCRGCAIAFPIVAAFLVLVPTSSIVPIADLAFEHRMYLPLAGVVAFTVLLIDGAARVFKQQIPSLRVATNVALVVSLSLVLIGLTGRTVLRNHDYASRISMWSTVVAARPEHARAWRSLGSALGEQKRLDEARSAFERSLALDPTESGAHHGLGKCAIAQGDMDAARAHFEDGLKIDASDGPLLSDYGWLLLQAGEYKRAERAIKLALVQKQLPFESRYNLAVLRMKTNPLRDNEAAAHLKQSLSIKPDYTLARLQLAWLQATSTVGAVRNGPAALQNAEVVLRHGRHDPAAWDVLAAAQAEVREFDAAVSSADHAIDLAQKAGREDLAESIQVRRNRYQRHLPYRRQTGEVAGEPYQRAGSASALE